MTSNPDYWQKIKVLFQELRKNGGIEFSDELTWVSNGLLVGVTKEMRQSTAIAHRVTYTILVDLISGIQEDDSREKAWKAEFLPRIHQYLTTNKANASVTDGLGHALTRVNNSHDLEVIWTDVCEYLIGFMSQSPHASDSGIEFKSVSQRWIDLTISTLSNFNIQSSQQKEDNPARLTFLKMTARPFEEAVSMILNSNGTWVEGTLFLGSLVENPLFWDTLSHSTEMQIGLQAFKDLVSPEEVVKLLHSPSSRPFIRIIVAYCNANDVEIPELWETLVNEAIAKNGPIDVQNPDALIYQLVSIVKPPTRATSTNSPQSMFGAPRGVNLNLVRELTTALKSYGNVESEEAKRLEALLISLCSLHGTTLLFRILTF